ncbi:hypothetical protein [Mesorhizobium japonicum]|uniref:Mlr6547 protein n=1 Tax=Mesorhizobium japonicum (strain LMG 29417 / CECT 9101 / MAFF 303099) TaxID=266835 RepID=Q988X9_RHILO|nr:hypothetical protein [Mesorhizobium japonicum]BAB52818.1 mlr6547 [Mesorhizobium japonicum MAFF 303099]
MTEDANQDHCSPKDQGNPGKPGKKCEPLDPGPKAPSLPELPKWPEACCCPSKPPATGTCLDDLIDEQAKLVSEAEQAKAFKAELEDLLKKAKAAKLEYTNEKFKDFSERWEKEDALIVDLIHKLVCAVPCWWCLIECEVCPLLYAIRDTELRLDGDGALTDKVYSLRDLRYWQERNRDAKAAVFDRIKKVLAAWEKPATTIDKNLADNWKQIEEVRKIIATESARAVLLVFLKLVPMHLAIAPRGATSKIESEYLSFCGCDKGTPDDCCGPDVGVLSMRDRLIGPQPYIVPPDKFFDIICCLATERYLPAKNQLAAATSDLAATEAAIKRATTDLEQKKSSVEADYKANVSNPVDCDKYKRRDGGDCGCGPKTSSSQSSSGDLAVR